MNRQTTLCRLESLNNDLLVEILATCDSFEDLAAFVRASPTLLRTFLAARSTVLLRVVGNILGPATRDAALLAKSSKFTGDDLGNKVDAAVRDYKARLAVLTPPWVPPGTLDADTVVALTRVTRLTQFWVDLFVYFRFRYFEDELRPAETGKPPPYRPHLSSTEYGRIAQAVVRRQLLVLMHGGKLWEPRNYPHFIGAIFSLFHAWELQQISDLDHFLGQLLISLTARRRRERTADDKTYAVNPRACEFAYAPSLDAYAAMIKSTIKSDPSLLEALCESGDVLTGRIFPEYGTFSMFKGSHRFVKPSASRYASFSGRETSLGSPPWAWDDAHGGASGCRWGVNLIKGPLPDTASYEGCEQVRDAVEAWRWFRMVFWDRERAEQLKQWSELDFCRRGWLVPWQD